MSDSLTINYEYTADHINDYVQAETFFHLFDVEDIPKILKNLKFSANDFVTLIMQSHNTITSSELYICTRKANVSVKNLDEVISTLKSVKTYMKLGVLNGIVDFLDNTEKEISDTTEKIQKLQEELIEAKKIKVTSIP
ncbi:hypothetical protein TVAG_469160 [Trichomonas vaginalis G3]|uniref:Uncharacterized protein n=1 Tax=Trichomonas vaginalis (strain ATCC PRA-98 / G3) TaxID=412133 RepID=A2FD86_TRIV3|nr:protein ubiquitination [Trichomonas vaginalis G3]EAX97142.1 hypothetical protein TVAG_469160 [Trichomonas vaginalis G3]KAI5549234.1 protein ubiquitination [Trichomonas vaginalis G3]|eukprot:XP_001310072.1 hypothetical protein [Trichomonas vaginalis G3]